MTIFVLDRIVFVFDTTVENKSVTAYDINTTTENEDNKVPYKRKNGLAQKRVLTL